VSAARSVFQTSTAAVISPFTISPAALPSASPITFFLPRTSGGSEASTWRLKARRFSAAASSLARSAASFPGSSSKVRAASRCAMAPSDAIFASS
jgi:hypothetical protein